MSRPTIEATRRDGVGKGHNRRLRASGRVPAIVYGNGQSPSPLSVDPRSVVELLNGPMGRNSVVNLQLDGESRLAMIKDYQVHPWKRKLLHVDFWEVTPETSFVIDVPFKTVGTAAAEQLGARVFLHRDTLPLRCTIDSIPEYIAYDMSDVEGEYAEVSVSEVTAPEGTELVFRKNFSVLRLKVVLLIEEEEKELEGEEAEEGQEEAAETADE